MSHVLKIADHFRMNVGVERAGEELLSVKLFSCGLLLQLLVEPWLVVFFQKGDLSARSAGEGAAVLTRTVTLVCQ